MLRLVAGMIAAFIVGGLVAIPFTSSSIAAQDETSDEGTVCCDETVQYGGIEFKTREACQNSNGVVVEDNKCEPEKELVCCDATAQYDTLEFATRANCKWRNGVVVEDNKCKPNDDAVAERTDAAGFEGARDIGDVPVLSPDGPIYQSVECGEGYCTCDTILGSTGCDGIYQKCREKGATSVVCESIFVEDSEEVIRSCDCFF